jgi:voltage-gated potassium channel Kch
MAVIGGRFVQRHVGCLIARRGVVLGTRAVLLDAGAGEVVQPEFEAGLEFVRHVLRRQGVSAREVELITSRRRTTYDERAQEAGVDR